MVITVYAIAKNEENVAERFAKSTQKADHVIVCDTGSTDNTINILSNYGVTVHSIKVEPFRFDTARNISLSYIPKDTDIAIAMDLDDILVDNWREIIEKEWETNTTNLKYLYPYVWQDDEQTVPKTIIWGFKIHCPNSYIWVDPIHEWLEIKGDIIEDVKYIEEEILIHHPETREDRKSRIILFELAVEEEPASPRRSLLYAKELFFRKEYKKAVIEAKRCLNMTVSYSETDMELIIIRARCCKIIASSLLSSQEGSPSEILTWLLRYVSESPGEREPWVYLAQGWYSIEDYISAYACIQRGLAITDKYTSPEYETWYWTKEIDNFSTELKLLALKQITREY